MFKPVALAALLLSTSAFACIGPQNRPTQTVSVSFEKNSATLTSKEIVRIASWGIDMKSSFPIQLWTNIVATSAPDEKNAPQLAARRATLVKDLAIQFGLANGGSEVHSYVDNAASLNGSFTMSGQIDLSPGCPNNCCDGQ